MATVPLENPDLCEDRFPPPTFDRGPLDEKFASPGMAIRHLPGLTQLFARAIDSQHRPCANVDHAELLRPRAMSI